MLERFAPHRRRRQVSARSRKTDRLCRAPRLRRGGSHAFFGGAVLVTLLHLLLPLPESRFPESSVRPRISQEALPKLWEAVTYLLARPVVQSGEGVNRIESGVLAGTYRPISSQDAINRRFN